MIYTIIFLITAVIAVVWVNGIDDMSKNHPDYKGKDLFNEDIKNEEK